MKISIEEFNKIPEEKLDGIYEIEDYSVEYYVNGKLHREDGPASEHFDGSKEWFINGELHRLDGPALEDSNGDKGFYIKNKWFYTKEEFDKAAYMYKNGLQDYL